MSSRTEHRFEVTDHPRLELDITSGEVRLSTGAPGVIVLSIETADPNQVEVVQVGQTVHVRKPWGWSARRRQVFVVGQVPPGAEVLVSSVSAEVRLDGEFGATNVHTVSGDIAIERVERLDVDSASGDVQVKGSGGPVAASSISGDVIIGHVRGRLAASLTSGDLRAERVDGDAEVNTMSGDIRIGRCDGDSIALKSVSGDITLGLPSGIRVEPEISTVSGSTSLPKGGAAPTPDGPRRRVRLRLRTVSGDIRLDRA